MTKVMASRQCRAGQHRTAIAPVSPLVHPTDMLRTHLPEIVLSTVVLLAALAILRIRSRVGVRQSKTTARLAAGGLALAGAALLGEAGLSLADEATREFVQASGARTLVYGLSLWLVLMAFLRQYFSTPAPSHAALQQGEKAGIATQGDSGGARPADGVVELYTDPICALRFDPPISVHLPLGEQIRRSYRASVENCNSAFAELVGAATANEVIGKRLGELPTAIDTVAHDRMFATFIRRGYRLTDYDRSFVTAEGNRRMRVNMVGHTEDGHVVSLWQRQIDAEPEHERQQVAAKQEQGQQLTARIATRLLTATSERNDEAIRASLRDICRFFDADRVTVHWRDLASRRVSAVYFWTESGGDPVDAFAESDVRWLAGQIERGELLQIDSLEDLPEIAAEDRRVLQRMGVKSLLVAPMRVEDQTVGALSLANTARERSWADRHLQGLTVVAASIGSAITRVRRRRQLDQLMAELASARDRLQAENVFLKEEIISSHGFDEIVGDSPALRRSLELVSRVAVTSTPVLIQGETGTGKELIARAIHARSDRSERRLVKVNCAALPANLIESELFGHVKGAFTGAVEARKGRFDLADGGTLFLDEVAELPLDLQAKLLRVLQDGDFQRVGGTETIRTDVRLIAATNRDLLAEAEAGRFRADLFYRINTFTIHVPPLRKRLEDIPLLARHFVDKYAAALGKHVTSIAQSSMRVLEAHDWPGNVRELEAVIQRALITTEGSVLHVSDVLYGGQAPSTVETAGTTESGAQGQQADPSPSAEMDLRSAEIAHIERVLQRCRWKISGANGAAAKLGLPPSTLRSRMQKYGIRRPPTQDRSVSRED